MKSQRTIAAVENRLMAMKLLEDKLDGLAIRIKDNPSEARALNKTYSQLALNYEHLFGRVYKPK